MVVALGVFLAMLRRKDVERIEAETPATVPVAAES